MWDGRSRRGPRRSPRQTPGLEGLDARTLLAASVVNHHLGAYIAPNAAFVRPSTPSVAVNAQAASETLLSNLLGPGITQVQGQLDAQQTPPNALVALALSNPFMKSILSLQDTYTLLSSPAMTSLIGSQPVGTGGQTADSVTLILPGASLVQLGTPTSLVQVPAMAGTPGFFVNAPTDQILTLPNGFISVTVPLTSLPPGVSLPSSVLVPTGSIADIFAATGPLLLQTSRSGVPQIAPNAPRTVPGLRLASRLAGNRNFPAAGGAAWVRILHLAADRKVFTLDPTQQALLQNGLTQFEAAVSALNAQGAFQSAAPLPPPNLPRGPLGSTLEISVGALRQLGSVDPAVSGLQLAGVGNFPGRLDVGLVFARNGDYGLALTARGPLQGNPPGLASQNQLGGDIRVEVSNAPNLSALDGPRVVEALSLGSLRMGDLQASTNINGVAATAVGAGYGNGLEFGTGSAFTQVIPLGNVFALIPSAPPRPPG